jgi:hypothetical protein
MDGETTQGRSETQFHCVCWDKNPLEGAVVGVTTSYLKIITQENWNSWLGLLDALARSSGGITVLVKQQITDGVVRIVSSGQCMNGTSFSVKDGDFFQPRFIIDKHAMPFSRDALPSSLTLDRAAFHNFILGPKPAIYRSTDTGSTSALLSNYEQRREATMRRNAAELQKIVAGDNRIN